MEDRLTRTVTDTPVMAPTRRTRQHWTIIGCVTSLVAVGEIGRPFVMLFAVTAGTTLLVVSSWPPIRDAVAVAHAAEIVTPIGVEADGDHIEAVVQIRLRHVSRGRRRPARRAHRYTNEALAHLRLHTAASIGAREALSRRRRRRRREVRRALQVACFRDQPDRQFRGRDSTIRPFLLEV